MSEFNRIPEPTTGGRRILAISGSLRTDSSNTRILESFREKIPADLNYQIYDGLGDLPHYNPVLDADPPLKLCKDFVPY